MNKPVLVIMAAGMGSRYGGLKQIDPIDREGHIIMDFSIYDARRAGFEKVIFIIKRENETEFKKVIGNRIGEQIEVAYAFQDLNFFLGDYSLPEGREKPWGTAHAILCCRDLIDGPFAVINADDYYGRSAFRSIYNFLSNSKDGNSYRYAMVGYELENTLTDYGHVARGVCEIDDSGLLIKITERTRIEKKENSAAYTEDGKEWTMLPDKTIVSMNMWGFQKSIIEEIENEFPIFLKEVAPKDSLKGEYFLPTVVGKMLKEKKATVQVLNSIDKWYGMTYKEDKDSIVNAIKNMKKDGLYPIELWRK